MPRQSLMMMTNAEVKNKQIVLRQQALRDSSLSFLLQRKLKNLILLKLELRDSSLSFVEEKVKHMICRFLQQESRDSSLRSFQSCFMEGP